MTEQQQTPPAPAPATTRFPISMEMYVCPNPSCEAVIPNHYIFPNRTKDPYVREVKAYCPACDSCWHSRQRVNGGVYQTTGPVARITAPKQIEGVKARVAHMRNDIQREALSA